MISKIVCCECEGGRSSIIARIISGPLDRPDDARVPNETNTPSQQGRALSREKALPRLPGSGGTGGGGGGGGEEGEDARRPQPPLGGQLLETFKYDRSQNAFHRLARIVLEGTCIDLNLSEACSLSPNPVVVVLFPHTVAAYDAVSGALVRKVDVTWRTAAPPHVPQRRVFAEAGRFFLCSDTDVAVTAPVFQAPFSSCNISHAAGARYRTLRREAASIKNILGFDIVDKTYVALVFHSAETSGTTLLWCSQDRGTGHLEILWEASFLTPSFETHIMRAGPSLLGTATAAAAAVVSVTPGRLEILGPSGAIRSMTIATEVIPEGYLLSSASLCRNSAIDAKSDPLTLLTCWCPGSVLGTPAVGAAPVFAVASNLNNGDKNSISLNWLHNHSANEEGREAFAHYASIIDSCTPLLLYFGTNEEEGAAQYNCKLLIANSLFGCSEILNISSDDGQLYHSDGDLWFESIGPVERISRCEDSCTILSDFNEERKVDHCSLDAFHCVAWRDRDDGGPCGSQVLSCARCVPFAPDRSNSYTDRSSSDSSSDNMPGGHVLDVGDVLDLEILVAENDCASDEVLAILTSKSLHQSSAIMCTNDDIGCWSQVELLDDFSGNSNAHTFMLRKCSRNIAIQVTENSIGFINVASRCRTGVKFSSEQLKITGSIAHSTWCGAVNIRSKLTQRCSKFWAVIIASRSSLRVVLAPEAWESGGPMMQRDEARILSVELEGEVSCVSAVATQSGENISKGSVKGSNMVIALSTWESNDVELISISEYGDQILRLSKVSDFAIGDPSPVKQIAIMTPQTCGGEGPGNPAIVFPMAIFTLSGYANVFKLSIPRSETGDNIFDITTSETSVVASVLSKRSTKMEQVTSASGASNSFVLHGDGSLDLVVLKVEDMHSIDPQFQLKIIKLAFNNFERFYKGRLCLNAVNGSIETEQCSTGALAAVWIHRSSSHGADTAAVSIVRGKFCGSERHVSGASLWIPGRVLKCHALAGGTSYGIMNSNARTEGELMMYEWTDGTNTFSTISSSNLSFNRTLGGPMAYAVSATSLGALVRTFAVPLIGDNFEAIYGGTPMGICFAKRGAQANFYEITVASFMIPPKISDSVDFFQQLKCSGLCSFELRVPKSVPCMRWTDLCISSSRSSTSTTTGGSFVALASYGQLVLLERRRTPLHPPSSIEGGNKLNNMGLCMVAKSDLASEAAPVLDVVLQGEEDIYVSIALIGIEIFEYRPSDKTIQSTRLVALPFNLLLASLCVAPETCIGVEGDAEVNSLFISGINILNREFCRISVLAPAGTLSHSAGETKDSPSVSLIASSGTTSNNNNSSSTAIIVPLPLSPERRTAAGTDPRLLCEALRVAGHDHTDLMRAIADAYRM